jgi:hypothetical protein
VPEDFVVPFDASLWPERMQGLKLGRYFKKLVTDAVRRAGGKEGGREGGRTGRLKGGQRGDVHGLCLNICG